MQISIRPLQKNTLALELFPNESAATQLKLKTFTAKPTQLWIRSSNQVINVGTGKLLTTDLIDHHFPQPKSMGENDGYFGEDRSLTFLSGENPSRFYSKK